MHASASQFVLILLLIGWKSGANLLSQSRSVVNARLITFWHSNENRSIAQRQINSVYSQRHQLLYDGNTEGISVRWSDRLSQFYVTTRCSLLKASMFPYPDFNVPQYWKPEEPGVAFQRYRILGHVSWWGNLLPVEFSSKCLKKNQLQGQCFWSIQFVYTQKKKQAKLKKLIYGVDFAGKIPLSQIFYNFAHVFRFDIEYFLPLKK